ncbi:MAG: uracil-DNA glycosylase, partial [Ruthenibacterium sp.]
MDFETLKQTCIACEKCDLCKTRTQVVFGMGNPQAEVLLIGEAPGKNEDEQGLPFIGRSGQLLDQFLSAIHLHRESNLFITN